MQEYDSVTWYVKKADGTVHGPTSFRSLRDWASEGLILPEDLLSRDNAQWMSPGEVPELQMEWEVTLKDGSLYGPFHLASTRQLVRSGLLDLTGAIENRKTHVRLQVRFMLKPEDLGRPPDDAGTAPAFPPASKERKAAAAGRRERKPLPDREKAEPAPRQRAPAREATRDEKPPATTSGEGETGELRRKLETAERIREHLEKRAEDTEREQGERIVTLERRLRATTETLDSVKAELDLERRHARELEQAVGQSEDVALQAHIRHLEQLSAAASAEVETLRDALQKSREPGSQVEAEAMALLRTRVRKLEAGSAEMAVNLERAKEELRERQAAYGTLERELQDAKLQLRSTRESAEESGREQEARLDGLEKSLAETQAKRRELEQALERERSRREYVEQLAGRQTAELLENVDRLEEDTSEVLNLLGKAESDLNALLVAEPAVESEPATSMRLA